VRKYFGLYRSVINLTAPLRRGGIFIPKIRKDGYYGLERKAERRIFRGERTL
jgi:hypothetical protein